MVMERTTDTGQGAPAHHGSILEAHPLLAADLTESARRAGAAVDAMVAATDDPAMTARMATMAEGASPRAVIGLDADHMEALYTAAHDRLAAGDGDGARELLLTMLRLEPHDERAIYALGASYQIEGDAKRAAELYALFVGLDATNPDGYLRLGECLLTVGERENAAGCFSIAAREAERGSGTPEALAHARRMLAATGVHTDTDINGTGAAA